MPVGFCCKISGEGVVESCITGRLGLGKHVDDPSSTHHHYYVTMPIEERDRITELIPIFKL